MAPTGDFFRVIGIAALALPVGTTG